SWKFRSAAISAVSSTAPAGMVAKLIRRMASCLPCWRGHPLAIASAASSGFVPASRSAERGLAVRSPPPLTSLQRVPGLWVGGPAALARIHADGRVAAADRLRSGARRRFAARPLHVRERVADVVQHRVLHCDLQMLAFAGAQAADVGAEDGDRHYHPGTGVA